MALAAAAGAERARLPRLERPALTGVLVREVVNFSLLLALDDVLLDGRADDLPAGLRLRLRLARLARSAATTTSSSSAPARSPPRCCSRASSRRCSGRSSSTSSSTPTTRSWPRRSTPRSSSRPRRCGSRRAPGSTAACRCSWRWSSGWTRAGACCTVPFIAFLAGFGWASFGILIAGGHEVDRELQLRRPAIVITPLFLVAGHVLPDRRAARVGAGRRAAQPALPLRAARAPRRLRLRGLGRPLPRGRPRRSSARWPVALAVSRMRRKLID